MSDQQAPQAQAPAPPVGPADVAAEAVVPQLIDALRINIQRAAAEANGAEVKDFCAGCLSLAQTIVMLDASRLADGTYPGAQAAASPPRLPPIRDANRDGVVGG